jgi:hypothetical protein
MRRDPKAGTGRSLRHPSYPCNTLTHDPSTAPKINNPNPFAGCTIEDSNDEGVSSLLNLQIPLFYLKSWFDVLAPCRISHDSTSTILPEGHSEGAMMAIRMVSAARQLLLRSCSDVHYRQPPYTNMQVPDDVILMT